MLIRQSDLDKLPLHKQIGLMCLLCGMFVIISVGDFYDDIKNFFRGRDE